MNAVLQALGRFLSGPEPDAARVGARHSWDELHIAVAGLLAEAAMLDGDFSASERQRLIEIAEHHFGMGRAEAESFVAEARRHATDAVDLYVFTSRINKEFDQEERLQLIEMLWEIVLADGRMDDLEANLLRRVAGLIGVTDKDTGLARQRVAARRAAET